VIERDDRCLDQLFAEQVAKTPDRTAVVFEDQVLTYTELDAAAGRLAPALAARGAGPGRLVALALPRSAEMVVAILAVLRTGAGYVPVDTGYPAERIAYILDDSRPVLAVTTDETAAALPSDEGGVPRLSLDDIPPSAEEAEPAPTATRSPDDPAYIIYTSGSTGRPKGVLVPHRNVSRLFTASGRWFMFGERDVWSLFHSFSFDFSVCAL